MPVSKNDPRYKGSRLGTSLLIKFGARSFSLDDNELVEDLVIVFTLLRNCFIQEAIKYHIIDVFADSNLN